MPFLRLRSIPALLSLLFVSAALAEDSALSGTFTPPAEFAGDLGGFRSPLLFNDSSEVPTTPTEHLQGKPAAKGETGTTAGKAQKVGS